VRLATLLALLAPLASCVSPRIEAEAEIQPFHLAVIPFDPAPAQSELAFREGELARAFADMLDGLSFSEVTLLTPPAGVAPDEFAHWPAERREAHWLAAARDCRADLVLDAQARLASGLSSTVTPTGWGTLALDSLFKLGALASGYTTAMCIASGLITLTTWNDADREYRYGVGFDGTLHELGPLLDPGRDADLSNRRAELMRVFVYDADAELDFDRRAGFLLHMSSFVLPSVMLPSSPERELTSLRKFVGAHLGKVFVQEVEFRKSVLLQGNELFPFAVERLELVRGGTGTALAVEVRLHTAIVDSMDGYRLWVDDALVSEGGFAPPVLGEGDARYALLLPLPELAPQARVRLELRDGAARQDVRTFTLRADRAGRWGRKVLALGR